MEARFTQPIYARAKFNETDLRYVKDCKIQENVIPQLSFENYLINRVDIDNHVTRQTYFEDEVLANYNFEEKVFLNNVDYNENVNKEQIDFSDYLKTKINFSKEQIK